MSRLLNTAEAAKAVGLSAYELRMGFKQRRYPAIEIGDEDSRVKRLRWNLDALEAALEKQLQFGGETKSILIACSKSAISIVETSPTQCES